jgi:hypothetical protein
MSYRGILLVILSAFPCGVKAKGAAMKSPRLSGESIVGQSSLGLDELYVQCDLHLFSHQNASGLKRSVPG